MKKEQKKTEEMEKNQQKEKEKENKNKNTTSTSKKVDDDLDLEDFQEEYDINTEEDLNNSNEKISKGMDPKEFSEFIATLTSQFINKKDKLEYIDRYVNTTTPILEIIDFEDLTTGSSLKELPKSYRAGIAGLGIFGMIAAGILMYGTNKPKNNKEGDKN